MNGTVRLRLGAGIFEKRASALKSNLRVSFIGAYGLLPMFFRKLIAPVEVKRVLVALDEEKRRINSAAEGGPLGPSLGFDVVKPRVVEKILKYPDNIKKDVASGKPPSAVALWLMMSVARDDLYLGTHHLFPGRLSMPGTGVQALNDYCCQELEKLGQITSDEKAAMIQATREEVRAAG